MYGSIRFPSSGGNNPVAAKLPSGEPGVVGSSPVVITSPLTVLTIRVLIQKISILFNSTHVLPDMPKIYHPCTGVTGDGVTPPGDLCQDVPHW